MSDDKRTSFSIDFIIPSIVVAVIFFGGDPDLVDALIYWLMK